jgi:two-component system, NtrC family, nitrogen regulation sensor histidine kinase NtrY
MHSYSPQSEMDLEVHEKKKKRRERWLILLLLVLFFGLTYAEFKLTKVSDTLPLVNSIFFFGLLNINVILLLALLWLIFRNVGKIFLERKSRLLGARLKTKLVLSFLGFSIIPTLVLFVVSSLYINSSFDKWFSIKIQNTLQASLEITHNYYKNADENTLHFAEHLANQLGERLPKKAPALMTALPPAPPTWLPQYLSQQRELLALNSIEFYSSPFAERILVSHGPAVDRPDYYPRLSLDLLTEAFQGRQNCFIQHIGSGDLIRCIVPVRDLQNIQVGALTVNSYIPISIVSKVGEITSVFNDYKDTNPLKYPIKTAYFVILVMITLLILFVAIWIGLFMARQLTVPLERLVLGAQAVGSGNLDVAIEKSGEDEIAVLVESFNRMIEDLKENRKNLTHAKEDLEKRQAQLEAILANIGTGVLVVDKSGTIAALNRAASQLLQLNSSEATGKKYSDVFTEKDAALLEVIRKSFHTRKDQNELYPEVTQWHFRNEENVKSLAAIATPLKEGSETWGVVVVIDDMTHLIKAQREVAWREVARRIAHEIKNPLTPIKLSAQRLQRRLNDLKGRDGVLLKECTDTIINHADELKEMVNEFSNFARLPQISPSINDLNIVIQEVVGLFSQAHPQIRIDFKTDQNLKEFEFDRDQIKRVLINLFDNAIGALKGIGFGKEQKIVIEIHFNEKLELVVIIVRDSGPGMKEEVLTRVFEPYFSTKEEGTGLGLAIVKRIINDHDGFIRVQSSLEKGTEFTIELPTRPRHSSNGLLKR